MSKGNPPKSRSSRYPNIGNLTIALLEHAVEPILGKDFIKELKLPYTNNQLRNKFRDALFAAEKKYIEVSQGSDIAKGMTQLHIADLDSIQKAFWGFVENPASNEFPLALYNQLRKVYPDVSDRDKASAVDKYLKILRNEIINIDEEVRKKVCAALLASIHDRVESIDNKLDILKSLEKSQNKMVDLLTRLATPYSGSTIGNQPTIDKVEMPTESKTPPLSIHRIDFEINEALNGLTVDEIEYLHEVISSWIPPLIAPYLNLDDFDRPYGKICESIVKTFSTLVETRVEGILNYFRISPFDERPEIKSLYDHARLELVNKIYKSQTLSNLPRNKKKNSIYLKSLSEIFPNPEQLVEPYGFYLVDWKDWNDRLQDLLIEELYVKGTLNWNPGGASNRLQLFYISKSKLSNSGNLTIIESKKSPNNLKSKLKQAAKSITGKKPDYYFHLVVFDDKSIRFISLDLDKIGYKDAYRLNITVENFSRFITGFAEDFLSSASRMIMSERQSRNYVKRVADQFSKDQFRN